jgi:hypothetical protein
MIRGGFRLLSLFVFVTLLGTMFPLGVAAQFPSQGQAQGGGLPGQGGGGRGGFYQGQNYGWSLSWGPEWTLLEEGVQEGLEAISLSNGVSDITLGGFTILDTPQNVVIGTANTLGGGQWQFLEAIFDEPDRAAAYFDAPQEGRGYFIDIIGTGGSSAVFLIWGFPAAQYDTEWDRFLALMDGFQWTTTS